jgi:hypothetical protein
MSDPSERQVYRFYREGLTCEEAFQRLFTRNGTAIISPDHLSKWLKDLDETSTFNNLELNHIYGCSLYTEYLLRTHLIFTKVQSLIYKGQKLGQLCFLNSRYALIAYKHSHLHGFFLSDSFHGQER